MEIIIHLSLLIIAGSFIHITEKVIEKETGFESSWISPYILVRLFKVYKKTKKGVYLLLLLLDIIFSIVFISSFFWLY